MEAAPGEEELFYARFLENGTKIGMTVLAFTYVVYLTGILSPHVPLEDLPAYWGLPVQQYLAQADVPAGWSWLRLIRRGDFLNFVGIATLASVTIACYALVAPLFLRKKNTVYAVLAALEVLVLLVAASGVLSSVGH